MADVKIDLSGSSMDGAVLANAASEATLQKLFDLTKSLRDDSTKKLATEKTLAAISLKMDKLVGGSSGSSSGTSSTVAATAATVAATAATASAAKGLAAMAGGSSNVTNSLASMAANSGTAGGSLAAMAMQSGTVSKLLGALGKTASMVGTVLGGIIGVVGSVINMFGGMLSAVISFTKEFMNGENRLSAFINAIADVTSNIPVLGSLIGGLIGMVGSIVETIEGWRDVHNQLTEIGAGFNNNLMQLRQSAAQAGMNLDVFAGIIKGHSETFAKFGTVTAGALRFASASAQMREEFMSMGYSLADYNDELAQSMDLQITGIRARNVSEHDLNTNAKALMMEMDLMAKLTGKSRKSQADAVQKQQQDAAFQMKLASMDAKTREQVNQEMMRMNAQFGETGGEMVKLRVLGMVPMTTEARMFAAVMPDVYRSLNSFTDNVLSSGMSAEKFNKALDETTINGLEMAGKDAARVSTVLQAAAAGIAGPAGNVNKVFQTIYQSQSKFIDATGTLNKQAILETLQQARLEQEKRDKYEKSFARFENTMNNLRAAIFTNIIDPLYRSFGPTIEQFVTFLASNTPAIEQWLGRLSNWIMRRMPDIINGIESFGEGLVKYSKMIFDIFQGGNLRQDLFDFLGLAFERAGIEIGAAILRALPTQMGGGEAKADKFYSSSISNWRDKQSELASRLNFETATRENADLHEELKNNTLTNKQITETLNKIVNNEKIINEAAKIREELLKKDKSTLSAQQYVDVNASIHGKAYMLKSLQDQMHQFEQKQGRAYDTAEKRRQNLTGTVAPEYRNLYEQVTHLRSQMTASEINEAQSGKNIADRKGTFVVSDENAKQYLKLNGTINDLTEKISNNKDVTKNTEELKKTRESLTSLIEKIQKDELATSLKSGDLVSNIAAAITLKEGAKPELHNPGNVMDSAYAAAHNGAFRVRQFDTQEQGEAALKFEIEKRIKQGNNLVDFFKTYAPRGHGNNNPEEYAKFVSDRTGIPTNIALNQMTSPGRANGSLGTTGRIFENFGRETLTPLHGLESVLTPAQMRYVVTESQTALVEQLTVNLERILKPATTAATATQITQTSNATEILQEILDVLQRANGYHKIVAQNS